MPRGPTSRSITDCAEIGNTAKGWANLKLEPCDPAEGFLAGQLAIKGLVDTRQVIYDAHNRAVQIRVACLTQNTFASTVDGKSGQYKNASFADIG